MSTFDTHKICFTKLLQNDLLQAHLHFYEKIQKPQNWWITQVSKQFQTLLTYVINLIKSKDENTDLFVPSLRGRMGGRYRRMEFLLLSHNSTNIFSKQSWIFNFLLIWFIHRQKLEKKTQVGTMIMNSNVWLIMEPIISY